MPPPLILDPSTLDFSQILVTREQLREFNPQRFEMEQIDGIIHIDRVNHIVVGFKNVRDDEFWVRGHMPGFPLLPGVLMCEASAQLVAYYFTLAGLKHSDFVAFGGMENVRFRGAVRPGDRLVLIGKAQKLHRRQTMFNVQGFVGKSLVFHADIIGVQFNTRDAGTVSES
ncbi:MAG: 3-hydroxyacyl-ACP dehydratase FabZ family protein [Gemmataceae bacterium]